MTGWDALSPESKVAWAAGLFEGEGSVTACHGRGRLSLKMVDAEPVHAFAAAVGGGKVYGPYGNDSMTRRDGFVRQNFMLWIATGGEAERIASLLHPYLMRARSLEKIAEYWPNHVETQDAVRPQDAFSGAAV